MSKFGTAIAFVTGAVLGGAAVWYFTKDYYAKLAEEEIESVKEAYSHKMGSRMKDLGNQFAEGIKEGLEESGKTPAVLTKVADKGGIAEYAERIKNGAPMEYSRTVVPEVKMEVPTEPVGDDQPKDPSLIPYVISPEEFAELDGYTPVSLAYFEDGVLSDEYGVIIDDIEEIVGDALNHFGDYEEDSVCVRNDAKRCDYQILREERTYDEFRATLPTNI